MDNFTSRRRRGHGCAYYTAGAIVALIMVVMVMLVYADLHGGIDNQKTAKARLLSTNATSQVDNVSISPTAVDTLEPTHSAMVSVTPTPHLRLTELSAELAESNGELENANIKAEIARIQADAEGYQIGALAEAQARAAERLLQPSQTAAAMLQTQSAWTPTPSAQPTPNATITQIAMALMSSRVDSERAQTEQAKNRTIGVYIALAVGVLGVWLSSALVTWRYRTIESAERIPVMPDEESLDDYLASQPENQPPITGPEFNKIASAYRLQKLTNTFSRRQIEESVFGYSNGRVGTLVQDVLDYLDEAPHPTATYADYIATTRVSQSQSQ